jgi:uncharacterized membrane protein YhaH (DUF805 family)
MNLNKLFSAEGRISRMPWWIVYALNAVAAGVVSWMNSEDTSSVLTLVGLFVSLALLWVTISTSIKRFHDHGRSGWWVLATIIPLVGIIWLGLISGQSGTNAYGEPNSGNPFASS